MGIYRGPGGSTDATRGASNEASIALEAKDIAVAAKDAALAAQAGAVVAQASATTSASSASTSATTATTQASSATASATSASNSATSATASASSASTSATTATTQATSATASSTSATASATSATASATSATSSATNSLANRNDAATSAGAASTSATNAATSATNAANSATSAATSAASASAVVLGNEPVRPTIRPSLLLDFANTKTLDPRITYTRASTGTYYDGVTTAKAEENLLLQSQSFDNASWGKFDVTASANAVTAPDGTTTAETLSETATTSFHLIGTAVTLTANTSTTISVFAKAGTANFTQLLVNNGVGHYISVVANLSTGAITQTNNNTATLTSSSITAVGSSWYRIVATFTFANVASISFYLGLSNSATPTLGGFGIISYAGNTANNIQLWGAQLEQRSAVTAYTPTTTQPITNYIPVLLTAQSNVPRFEHNPITGESLGLEIEESRTNLTLYSDDYSNATWVKSRCSITSNTIVAPDGTLTGDKLFEDTTASNSHFVEQTASTNNAVTYTFSVYAKASERTFVTLQCFIGASFSNTFNLSTGVVTGGNGVGTITAVGNGWYRVTSTATATATATGFFDIFINNGSVTYTGNGYSGIYIWGAQLEAGAFATSYIPTVASQVTRAADNASMTGTNFSSWYRADEGTVYCESATVNITTSDRGTWAIGNNSLSFGSGNMMYETYAPSASGQRNLTSVTNGVQVVSSFGTATTQTINTFSKSAYAYALNNFSQSTNSASPVTDSSGTLPQGVTGMSIGALFSGWSGATQYLNGTIKKIAYYPARITNTQLQGVTTV